MNEFKIISPDREASYHYLIKRNDSGGGERVGVVHGLQDKSPNPLISFYGSAIMTFDEWVLAINTVWHKILEAQNEVPCSICDKNVAEYVDGTYGRHGFIDDINDISDLVYLCKTCAELGLDCSAIPIENVVYAFRDDIDRDADRAGHWPFNSNGKSYGVGVYNYFGERECQFRVYGPTEEAAELEAEDEIQGGLKIRVHVPED
jgi:hypothetical protein